MTHLGWSPTLRDLLRVKRKSEPTVDRNEDGARAIFKDEAIATVVAELSKNRDDFVTTMHVDSDVVTVIRDVATGHEVAELPRVAWKPAICDGIDKMRKLERNKGGVVGCDLKKQNMMYWPPGDPSSIDEKLKQLRSAKKAKTS